MRYLTNYFFYIVYAGINYIFKISTVIVESVGIFFDVTKISQALLLLIPLLYIILFSFSGAFGLILYLCHFAERVNSSFVKSFEQFSDYLFYLGLLMFYIQILLILLVGLIGLPFHSNYFVGINDCSLYILTISQTYYIFYLTASKIVEHNSIFNFKIYEV